MLRKSNVVGGRASKSIAAAVAVASVSVWSAHAGDILTGLTHRYTFDETSGMTAADNGSAPSNGTIVGGVTVGVPGVLGNAFLFNGSTGYVNTNTTALLPASGAFSVFVWTQSSSALPDNTQRHLVSNNNGQTNRFNLGINNPAGGLANESHPFVFHNGASASVEHTTNANDGQWHLVGATRSAANVLTLYLDGVAFGTTATDSAVVPTTVNNWLIGAQPPGNRALINGIIDDVRVYNRALALADIADLYAFLPAPIPTASWDGGGADGKWTTAQNWVGDAVPSFTSAIPASLTFSGTSPTASLNDVASANVSGIVFDSTAGSFSISGNGFELKNLRGIANNSVNTQTFNTTGSILINGGSIASNSGDIAIASPLQLGVVPSSIGGAKNVSVSGKISGTGSLEKTGTGSLLLTNTSNDFTGGLIVTGGNVPVSNDAVLGASSATLTLSNNGTGADGKVSLSGGVTINRPIIVQPRALVANVEPAHFVNDGGNNTIAGPISVQGGGSQDAAFESNGGKLTITSNITNDRGAGNLMFLRLQGSGEGEFTGNLLTGTSTAAIGVTKVGTGTWTIPGGTQVTGNLFANEGILKITTSPVTSPTITVAGGATLDVTAVSNYQFTGNQIITGGGTIKSTVATAYGDNRIVVGDAASATLSVNGDLTFDNSLGFTGGGTYLDLGTVPSAGGNGNDLLKVSGNLSLVAGTPQVIGVSANAGYLGAGSYTVVSATNRSGSATYNAIYTLPGGTVSTNANYRAAYLPNVVETATGLDVVISSGPVATVWKGGLAANAWDTNTTANFLNGASPENFFWGDAVTFNDTTANNTVVLTGTLNPAAIAVDTANTYTFQGAGTLVGTSTLTKTGTGTLVLAGTVLPSWTGVVKVNNGALSTASLGLLSQSTASDRLILDGGTLRYTGPAITTGRLFTVGVGNGTIENAGTGGISMTGTGTMGFTGSGPRTLTIKSTFAGTNLFNTAIGDGAGGVTSLVVDGAAASQLTLGSASNSFGGTVTVNAGRLNISALNGLGSAAGTTTVNGGGVFLNPTVASGTFAESMVLNGLGFNPGVEQNGAFRLGTANRDITATGTWTIASDANIGVDDVTSRLSITGLVTGPGKLSKVQSGTLLLANSANNWSGGAEVKAGQLHAYRIPNGPLTVTAGKAVILSNPINNASTSYVTALTLTGGATPTVQLALNNNTLIVDNAGATTRADVEVQVKAGSAGGLWNGNGINSTNAAAAQATADKTALGIASAGDLGVVSFNSQSITNSTAAIVKYTLVGDADLDGKVNTIDFNNLAGGFGGGDPRWFTGDFNYSGVVDSTDFNNYAANYGKTLAVSAPLPGPQLGSVVPEPTTLGVIAMLGTLLVRRRKVD